MFNLRYYVVCWFSISEKDFYVAVIATFDFIYDAYTFVDNHKMRNVVFTIVEN